MYINTMLLLVILLILLPAGETIFPIFDLVGEKKRFGKNTGNVAVNVSNQSFGQMTVTFRHSSLMTSGQRHLTK